MAEAVTELKAEEKAKQRNKPGLPQRIALVTGNILFALILLLMAVLVFSMVQSRIKGGPPALAGHQMYIVLSGSMSPTFETGSLVLVHPTSPDLIRVGDIITYKGQSGGDMLTTHRVAEIRREGGLSFITKGDANDINDGTPVPTGNVLGTVAYAVPYLGYLMGFAQTKKGLISLVFIPGVLIIIFELRNLFSLMTEMEKEKKQKEAGAQYADV